LRRSADVPLRSRNLVRRPLENPRAGLALIFRPCLCVLAKRLRDVCALPESEPLWRAGRDFVVRDLPWTVEKLRVIPPFEFENWAVIALGGIPNKVQVGDMGAASPEAWLLK
jgi:hypothetical protein